MSSRSLRRPEILAPAGDDESLRAAVRAGADAVYFGLQGFNARARAKNFDIEGLTKTLEYIHEHGVKGYVTLNTLVFDSELANVENAVRACAKAGVDAVIVQDFAVARMVREIAPGLPIHASTQMTCTDAGAVEMARSLGASRVILARELSLDDITAIRERTEMDLEVFVHGALCIAYSGQCLTSEAIGGRSANRGACAQACRLPYELVVDGVLRDLGDRAYLLSPEDLEASAVVPKLMELGVASIKIEGRLKGPEYVAATTALYRAAIDAAMGSVEAVTSDVRDTALQMYSRGSGVGFLGGVDHQRLVEARACDHRGLLAGTLLGVTPTRGRQWLHVELKTELARGDGILVEGAFAGNGEIGGRIWGILRNNKDVERAPAGCEALVWLGPDRDVREAVATHRIWKTNDPNRSSGVLARIEREPHRVAINVHVSGTFGSPAIYQARTERGDEVRVEGDTPIEQARSHTPAIDVLRDKLGRLGDSPFALSKIESTLPEGAMIAPSSINRARRLLVDRLIASAQRSHATTDMTYAQILETARVPNRIPPPKGLFVLCRTLDQAFAAIDAGADGLYLDFLELTGTGAALRALRARGNIHITVAPPRIRKPGEEKIDRFLAALSPDAILVRGLGALREPAIDGIPRIGDFSLNVTNRVSAAEVLSHELIAFTPSFDLDSTQLANLLASPFGKYAEVVVHHPMPLFHMEHCVIAALLSNGKDHRDCGRPCDRHQVSLRDRAGMNHPVEADVGCRNTVFHAAAQSAAGLVNPLQGHGVGRFRIELVRETTEDVTRIVSQYRSLMAGDTNATEVWRTLQADGGYGVVRGSLRVISA